ncbi:response regulator transcription factor [Paenibacillus agaridevorans]|uniref:response regulator transcription factor n=1 Tax=Paenibacillus agaridevorans TaxID=171404 RepID=UPI001BE4C682|nr:response regulator [Paenibacillus agaridevorans]
MIRLLIVDNERLIVESLLDLFRQSDELEIEAFGVYSGQEALEMLERMKFDIVLSDIRMPGLDGLELQKEIVRQWPWCKIIFLSGYDEFQYIQQVMRNGGVEYLLKMEGPDAILRAVEKASAQLYAAVESKAFIQSAESQMRMARPLLINDYLLEVLQGDRQSLRGMSDKFAQWECPLDARQDVLLVMGRVDDWRDKLGVSDRELMLYAIQNIAEELWTASARCLTVRFERNKLLWLMQPAEGNDIPVESALRHMHRTMETVQISCRQTLKLSVSLAASAEFLPWNQVAEQFSALTQLLGRGLGMGKELILLDDRRARTDKVEVQFHQVRSQLGKLPAMAAYLENGQKEHFMIEFDKLAALPAVVNKDDTLKLEIYYSTATLFLSYMNRWELHKVIGRMIDLAKLVKYDAHSSWHEALSYLSQLAECLFEQKHNDHIYSEDDLVKHIRLYVEHNLAGDLSLTRIGEVVGYNPYYLTKLYRRITNEALTDFIASVRLAKARKLLEQGDVIVQDISKSIGFMTEHSFYRFFKKATGLTPQEYRERQSVSKKDNEK